MRRHGGGARRGEGRINGAQHNGELAQLARAGTHTNWQERELARQPLGKFSAQSELTATLGQEETTTTAAPRQQLRRGLFNQARSHTTPLRFGPDSEAHLRRTNIAIETASLQVDLSLADGASASGATTERRLVLHRRLVI